MPTLEFGPDPARSVDQLRSDYAAARKRLWDTPPRKPAPLVRLVRHLPANVGLPSWFGELAEFNETLRERFMVRPDDDAPIRISGIRVLRIVARHFGLNVETLAGDCRRAIYVRPRYIGYYLCVHVAGLSTPRTGALFGGRDHSTIVQGLKKIEARVAVSPDLANMIRDLTAQCREAAWL